MSDNFSVALMHCFLCGDPGPIVMNTKLTKRHAETVEQMHGKTAPGMYCSECEEHLKDGIAFLSVRDDESGEDPYRTGRMAIIKEEKVRQILEGQEILDRILSTRFCYVDDKTWSRIGLPEGDK